MKNLKIGVRLLIGFASALFLIIAVALFSWGELKNIEQQTDNLARVNFVKAQLSADVQGAMQAAYRGFITTGYIDDGAVRAKEKERIEKQRTRYRESFKKLEELERNAEGKAILEKITRLTQVAAAANDKALKQLADGNSDEARSVIKNEANAAMDTLLDSFDELSAYQKKQVESRYAKAVTAYESALTGLLVGYLVALVIAVACTVVISRSIVVPLRSMIVVMRDIAEGERDLTKNIYLLSKDELGEFSKWFDMFMDNIQEDITNIGASTHQIASAAVQLHTTAEQIATGAKEVAAQAGNVADACKEMSVSSADIAQNCSKAAEGSRLASEAAVSGARVVDETIAVMKRSP